MDSKILWKIFMLLTIIFLMDYCHYLISPECEELMTESIYQEKHNGVICLKYRDSTNHGSPVMFTYDGKDTTELKIVNSIQSKMWKELSVGDSLYKKINTYEYTAKVHGVIIAYVCKCPDQ